MDCEGDNCALSKPALNDAQVIQLIEQVFGLQVSEIRSLPSYSDQSFYIRVQRSEEAQDHDTEFVLKITNSDDSQKNGDLMEVQTQIMMFLRRKGFPSPTPFLTKDGQIMSLESIAYGFGNKKHMVRLLTFLPGTELAQIPVNSHILYEVGKTAALLDKALQEEFQHPNIRRLHREKFLWNLSNVPQLERFLYVLGQSREREVVEQVIQQFKEKIQPNVYKFRPCINHGDFNDQNILLEQTNTPNSNDSQEQYKISGILDFDDMSYGYFVFEVAIAIMYMMIESKDPINVGGHVLAGFESVIPLNPEEKEAVFLLVNCRFSQSLVLARYNVSLCPENEDYLMITAKTGWKHLLKLWDMGKNSVEKIWFGIADSYKNVKPL